MCLSLAGNRKTRRFVRRMCLPLADNYLISQSDKRVFIAKVVNYSLVYDLFAPLYKITLTFIEDLSEVQIAKLEIRSKAVEVH